MGTNFLMVLKKEKYFWNIKRLHLLKGARVEGRKEQQGLEKWMNTKNLLDISLSLSACRHPSRPWRHSAGNLISIVPNFKPPTFGGGQRRSFRKIEDFVFDLESLKFEATKFVELRWIVSNCSMETESGIVKSSNWRRLNRIKKKKKSHSKGRITEGMYVSMISISHIYTHLFPMSLMNSFV